MSPDGIYIAARVGIICVVFAFFVFIPLKSRYRYSLHKTCMLVSALVLITIAVTIIFLTPQQFLSHYSNLGIVLWICMAVAVFCMTLKGTFWELLFTVLVILNLYVNIMAIARVIVCTWLTKMPQTLAEMLVSTGVLLLYTPFLYILLMRCYKPVIELDVRLDFWRVIWIIPALTYLVFFVKIINDYWRQPVLNINGDDILFCILWSFTTYILFVVTLMMLLQSYKGTVAAQQARNIAAQLQMQQALYDQMMGNIKNTARLRHDWRHHLLIINGFAETGNTQSLRAYLQQLIPEYIAENDVQVCENKTVDILLRYYRFMARELGIGMEIQAQLPQNLKISAPDIGIVFGNLLENAVQACESQHTEERSIIVRTFMKESQLVVMIKNTYDHQVLEQDGKYQSTKHEGDGRGIASARDVVEKYQGIIKIEHNPPYFTVHILMNPSKRLEKI